MTIQPGQTLLHYRIVDKLGEGGMGVVWRARDTKLQREVALKTLPPEMAADSGRRARFERESQAIATEGFAVDAFLEIAIPLTAALSAAHVKGITHRDIKPDNMMLTAGRRGTVREDHHDRRDARVRAAKRVTRPGGFQWEGLWPRWRGPALIRLPIAARGRPCKNPAQSLLSHRRAQPTEDAHDRLDPHRGPD